MNKEYIGIIEIGESVLYIEKDDTKLYAGTGSNSGVSNLHEAEIDDAFSIDENLQDFLCELEEIYNS